MLAYSIFILLFTAMMGSCEIFIVFFVAFMMLGYSQSIYGDNYMHFQVDFISFLMVFVVMWMYLVLHFLMNKYLGTKESVNYTAVMFFLLLFLIITFGTFNYFTFYIFFEMGLFPLVYLILNYGYQVERLQASFYLFFYTMAGSLPLLLFFSYFYMITSSTYWSLLKFFYGGSGFFFEFFFFFVMLSFFVKLPLFLFHLWLPKAHVEAPVSGSMILAAIMLKLGGYGVYRVYFIFHSLGVVSFFLSFSLWGAFLCSIICLVQADMKALVAYSSVSHMGVMMAGLFMESLVSMKGFMVIMLSHAFCSSALFFLVGYYYERNLSRQMLLVRSYSVGSYVLGMFWFLFLSVNFAAPPFLSLFGELGILVKAMMFSKSIFLCFGFVSFFVAAYCLFLYNNIFHGNSFKSLSFLVELQVSYLVLVFHLFPLLFLVNKLEVFI